MKIYKLDEELTHLLDSEMVFDAASDPFEGKDIIGYNIIGAEIFMMPKEIYCRANFNLIPEHTDFPVTDLTFPIFSIKMIETIESVRPFSKRLLQMIMVDDTYLDDYIDGDGRLKRNVPVDISYFGVQFTESLSGCFDFDNSIFKPMRSRPDFPNAITKFVLKEPKKGFPSIFKIEEKLSAIFITQETKDALEKNDIKGCIFEEVEVS